MRKTRAIVGAVLVAVLAGATWLYGSRRPAEGVRDDRLASPSDSRGIGTGGAGDPTGTGRGAQSVSQPSGAPGPLTLSTSGSSGLATPGGSAGGPPAQQALAAYRQWARYPPTSRPIAEQPDQVHPHSLVPTVRPLNPNQPDKATIRQAQDRLYLVPGEGATVTLSASVAGTIATAVVDSADLAKLQGAPPALSPPVAGVLFRDDGVAPDVTANDGVLTATVQPPVASLSGYTGDLRLTASVRVNGQQGEVSFPFVYTGDAPARFTGAVREALEDGSLALYVGIEIRFSGRYVVVGRLYEAGDQPVALLQQNDIFDTSVREIRLLAFGKVLRDAGAASPFTLRDVQGWRMNESGYPDRQLLDMWSGPYQTATYPPTTFSDREWDSPSKRNRLAGLQQVANGPP